MGKNIVILVHNVYYMGGTTRAVTNLANMLNDIGHNVTIVSVFKGQRDTFFKFNENIKLKSLIDYTTLNQHSITEIINKKIRKIFTQWSYPQYIHPDEPGINQFSRYSEALIIRFLKHLKCDMIISTRASYNLLVAQFAPEHVIKIAQEHMLFEKHSQALKESIIKYYSKFDLVISLTQKDKDIYESHLTSSRIKVIPNALPKGFFNLKTDKEKSNIIISAGRFEKEKGFDLLIKTIALIKDDIRDWKVNIYGDGKEKAVLQELIEKNNLNEIITLHPTTKNLPTLLEESKIYILPSRYEGFGLVLIEAMAKHNAVVAYGCPVGPLELINDEVNGLLAQAESLTDLSNQILKVINNQSLFNTLQHNGFEFSKKFEYEVIRNLWKNTIESVNKTL
ncbi:glycosyltransferase family 4 protein [Macrococcoides caseolyticum]|uniref:glycosyltransferase family 4 protein n=1 Tax=Macrococcoides caseolyticum TaxID=69966 RepID=UPI0024BCC7DD|nr:glycosyltransferase family 4 protein [Macrococcus caseolyticus]MDJ1109131.1 glycosyltransferase family 4 protein [Macrococcus caseolyticus]